MLRATRSLIFDTVSDIPYFLKSEHSTKNKWKIFLTYIRLSFKLFTIHRYKKITEEKIFGLKISFFNYGTFHFLFREIFIRNIYYFNANKKQPVIVDCGANIGIATLFFKWLYPQSVIYAIEPDPETFSLLEKNIKQNNLKNITSYNVALWDKTETIDFYIDKSNPGWLTMSVLKERLPKDKIRVKAKTLSSIIKTNTVDFLKMDVEGIEYRIILELIRKNKLRQVNEMVIEYHHGIDRTKPQLSLFLHLLEKNNLYYHIGSIALPLYQKHQFQDINIYAYKK